MALSYPAGRILLATGSLVQGRQRYSILGQPVRRDIAKAEAISHDAAIRWGLNGRTELCACIPSAPNNALA